MEKDRIGVMRIGAGIIVGVISYFILQRIGVALLYPIGYGLIGYYLGCMITGLISGLFVEDIKKGIYVGFTSVFLGTLLESMLIYQITYTYSVFVIFIFAGFMGATGGLVNVVIRKADFLKGNLLGVIKGIVLHLIGGIFTFIFFIKYAPVQIYFLLGWFYPLLISGLIAGFVAGRDAKKKYYGILIGFISIFITTFWLYLWWNGILSGATIIAPVQFFSITILPQVVLISIGGALGGGIRELLIRDR